MYPWSSDYAWRRKRVGLVGRKESLSEKKVKTKRIARTRRFLLVINKEMSKTVQIIYKKT